MKSKNKKATSIVESVVVIFIITSWILWMFKVYISAIRLSQSTSNRIAAIQIAREWIEAMESIRWTNWILYSSDNKNCWNTLNYNPSCVWNTGIAFDITHNESFVLKAEWNNRWVLSWATSWASNYISPTYKNDFRVKKDSSWFYTQSWWIDFNPIFTREILVSYIDTNGWILNSNDEKMLITSLVQWSDSSSKKVHRVKLETLLSNWKK